MIKPHLVGAGCLTILLMLHAAMGSQSPNRVITWGENTSDWNQALNLGALRLGCSGAPASCVGYADQATRSEGVSTAFLAIILDVNHTPDYMRQYSQLSLNHPSLYEVGFDDFVGQAERQKLPFAELSSFLSEVADSLKSANPKLHLGITVYQDEFYAPRFPLDQLDEHFRRSVDFVHLYPHYRKEAEPFAATVQRAIQVFPQAKIIAGNYAYDRVNYLPCARGNSAPCTDQEEVSLFAQTFKERLAMLGNSDVAWMEFYPGRFGSEAQLDIWNDPRRGCHPDRIQQCVQNTKAMREIVRQALHP